MARYRKKPVVIEARQVPRYADYENRTRAFLDDSIALAEWCGGKSHMMTEDGEKAHAAAIVTGPHILIPTLEGDHAALEGDWIIKGVQGEFYPCKPDIFDETYEEVT